MATAACHLVAEISDGDRDFRTSKALDHFSIETNCFEKVPPALRMSLCWRVIRLMPQKHDRPILPLLRVIKSRVLSFSTHARAVAGYRTTNPGRVQHFRRPDPGLWAWGVPFNVSVRGPPCQISRSMVPKQNTPSLPTSPSNHDAVGLEPQPKLDFLVGMLQT